MSDETPITQLAYALILSALRRRVERIVIEGEHVCFDIDGVLVTELSLPHDPKEPVASRQVIGQLSRRLGVLAEVPVYGRGESGHGRFALMLPVDVAPTGRVEIAVTMTAHGPAPRVELVLSHA